MVILPFIYNLILIHNLFIYDKYMLQLIYNKNLTLNDNHKG